MKKPRHSEYTGSKRCPYCGRPDGLSYNEDEHLKLCSICGAEWKSYHK